MQAEKTRENLSLIFSMLESRILQTILREIALNYKIDPEKLDPKAASAWYSTRGCQTARMSAEETREWVENLHHYKSANARYLLKWSQSLDVPKAGQRQIKLKLEEAPILLTALNDHRLLLAAR